MFAKLHRDGRITQDMSFRVICTFYGYDCRWKVEQQQQLALVCKEINSVHIKPWSAHNKAALTPNNLKLQHNTTQTSCCQDPDTFLQIFSEAKNDMSTDILDDKCSFTDFIEEECNRSFGILKRSRFCTMGQIIISEYTRNLCLTGEIVQNTCDLASYGCLK